MRRATGIASFLLFLLGFSALGALAGDLTQAEIEGELVGRHILWWEDGGWQTGHLVLSPDGAAELSLDRPARGGDSGRWAWRDGQLCTAWSQMRGGSEKCYTIRRGADGNFVTSGGNVFEVREAGA